MANLPAQPVPDNALQPDRQVRIGALLGGRYRLEQHIASGGMGRVFRARDEMLQRRVAIKVLREQADWARRESFRQRFVREANTAAQLTHPHCVTLFDYGLMPDGTCYMTMELLRGETLAALLRREGRLGAARALRIAQQIAAGLGAVHAMGAMHRDLKPGNIFMLEGLALGDAAFGQDFVKVLDFGLTKQVGLGNDVLTSHGQTLGSPHYMAPEQVRGGEVDGRVDVYALGAVLFELLTGRPPYTRSTPLATMMAHLDEPTPHLGPTPPPDCPEGAWHLLGALLQRALAKSPQARFSSIAAFAEGLGQVQLRMTSLGEPHWAADKQRDGQSTHKRASEEGWQILQARGALAFERDNDSDISFARPSPSETTWGRELRFLAGQVGEPPPRRRAARRPRQLAATWLGEAEWQMPKGAMSGLGPPKTRLHRRKTYRRMGLDALLAVALAALSVLHGTTQRTSPSARLHILSQPAGAKVFFQGEEVCPHTPCRIWLPEVHQGEVISLHIAREGCEEFVGTRRVGRYPQRLKIRLKCRGEIAPRAPQ